MIELHDDVGAQVALDLHYGLGREETARTVDVRLKLHSFLVDCPQLREGKDLKAAGVSKNRTVPIHESMQPTHLPHDLVAWPQMQVIGVAEYNRCAHLC